MQIPAWLILLSKISEWLAYAAMLIPYAVAQKNRKHLTGGLKTLRFVPLFLFIMYCLMHICIRLFNYSIPLNHLNTFGETLLYLKIYYDEFTQESHKFWLRVLGAGFIIFAIADSFLLEGFDRINSYSNLAESILIISIGLLFFESLLLRHRTVQFSQIPMFVATVGIIFYLAGTVAVYLASNHFIAVKDEYNYRIMYLISSGLLLLLAVLLTKTFILAGRRNANINISSV